MNQKYQYEILGIVFSIAFCALFVLPIYIKTGTNYQFLIPNIFAIIIFVTFARWIFLWQFSPFSRINWFRFLLIFLPIPLFMYQIDSLLDFTGYIDEHGSMGFFMDVLDEWNYAFAKYIRYQFLFFSTASLITIILLPMRMIRSFWRTINTKLKV